ncbi:MAG: sulfite exporter TauE/SafE family protein [Spirochaetales bacterium]|nr:sulfite exporter TauE/SafE family protein [Spirochaetales bacterium]
MADLLLLAGLVFFAYTAQAMTGFGSVVIALTLGALFFPMRAILPVLVALNLPLCLWIVYRQRSHIDRPLLFGKILPFMALGGVIGILLESRLEGPVLRQGFGLLILSFALYELWYLLLRPDRAPRQSARFVSSAWMLLAGLFHGIYASGGPALVQALGSQGLGRQVFRATLMAVWLLLNGLLLGWYVFDGRFAGPETRQFLLLLPTIPLALRAGDWLHWRISERLFRITLQLILALSALALLT